MKGFIDEKYLTEHPEGKLRLLDGNLLDGYKKDCKNGQADAFLDDALSDNLFVENAHRLFYDRSIIMKDSRMFLAPVRVRNNLAYTGRHGFQNATLGIYLEWWETCKYSRIANSDSTFSLVYFLAGSPLSGMNDCMAIDADGSRRKVSLGAFFETWRAFTGINMRYELCKQRYEAYSLEEVIKILKSKEKEDDRLHISGERLCLGRYIGRTQSFSDLTKSKKYRKQVIEALKLHCPEHPNKITELALFLKNNGIEVDAIGTSESDVKQWINELGAKFKRESLTDDYYLKQYSMTREEYFRENYNEVSDLTAKCIEKESWYPVQKEYPELEIGKIYKVSHIGVFRSFTRVVLAEFGDKEYSAGCFELFENGESIDRTCTNDRRFWAPYLREWLANRK